MNFKWLQNTSHSRNTTEENDNEGNVDECGTVEKSETPSVPDPEPTGYSSEAFDSYNLQMSHYVPYELFISEVSNIDPHGIPDEILSSKEPVLLKNLR